MKTSKVTSDLNLALVDFLDFSRFGESLWIWEKEWVTNGNKNIVISRKFAIIY